MQLVLKLKLATDEATGQALLEVQQRYVACCNDLSRGVFEQRNWSKFTVQREHYYPLKQRYGVVPHATVDHLAAPDNAG